jgi:hypothetical protein
VTYLCVACDCALAQVTAAYADLSGRSDPAESLSMSAVDTQSPAGGSLLASILSEDASKT